MGVNPPGGGLPPPGWYDDGTGVVRWWDGALWTEHVLADPPPTPPEPQQPEPPRPAEPQQPDPWSTPDPWAARPASDDESTRIKPFSPLADAHERAVRGDAGDDTRAVAPAADHGWTPGAASSAPQQAAPEHDTAAAGGYAAAAGGGYGTPPPAPPGGSDGGAGGGRRRLLPWLLVGAALVVVAAVVVGVLALTGDDTETAADRDDTSASTEPEPSATEPSTSEPTEPEPTETETEPTDPETAPSPSPTTPPRLAVDDPERVAQVVRNHFEAECSRMVRYYSPSLRRERVGNVQRYCRQYERADRVARVGGARVSADGRRATVRVEVDTVSPRTGEVRAKRSAVLSLGLSGRQWLITEWEWTR